MNTKKSHGGKRKGAGRRTVGYDTKTVSIQIRVEWRKDFKTLVYKLRDDFIKEKERQNRPQIVWVVGELYRFEKEGSTLVARLKKMEGKRFYFNELFTENFKLKTEDWISIDFCMGKVN